MNKFSTKFEMDCVVYVLKLYCSFLFYLNDAFDYNIIERTNPFPLHCVFLGCSASFLFISYNNHSYTTNATTRQDGFKKFVRCGDRVAFVNKTFYTRLDLSCFSVTGSLPPLWVTKVYLPYPDPCLLTRGIAT